MISKLLKNTLDLIKNISKKVVNLILYKEKDSHEFEPLLTEIEERPVNPLGQTIFWTIITAIVVLGLWSYFGKVDVVVSARGIIIPVGEQKIIQALDKGIVSSILVEDGDYVEEGQVLTIINPAEHEPGLELNNIKEEKVVLKERIAATKVKLNIAKEKESRMSEVKDILPKAAYDEAYEQVSSLTHELNSYTSSYNELTNREEQLTKQTQVIKSPIDGYVTSLQIHTIGGVVTPAQALMTVVPKDSELAIKAKVMNNDIGFVEEGMDVSVKIDTYNFQKYGLIKGKVTLVSHNSIDDERMGPVFEIYIKPTNTTLFVEGKEQSIKPGMSTTNEVNIGKRRILEFFIYPLIKYAEGMQVL